MRVEKDREQFPVSGPSFLGLADESTDRVAYLLEDEPGGSRGAHLLVIIILLLGCAYAGWHWRGTLRAWAMRAMQHPASAQSQETSYKTAPISTSGSEVAGTVPNATAITEMPPPGSNQNQAASPQAPPSQAPATQGTSNQAPTTQASSSQAAAGEQGPAQASPSQAPTTGTPQTKPVESSGVPEPGQTAVQQPSRQATAAQQVPTSAAAIPATTPAKDATTAKKEQAASGDVPLSEQTSAGKKSPNPASQPQAQPQIPESPDQAVEAEGEKYLYGSGVPADCARAQKDLLAAGEHTNPKAASVLGTMYATGHCVTRDLPLAYFWFAKAMREDPNNVRVENALLMVWSQMTPQERELAVHHK